MPWSGSVREVYEKMITTSNRLDGPLELKDYSNQGKRHSSSYHNTNHHLSCTKSGEFLASVEDLFQAAYTGLTLEQVGNPFYRKLTEDWPKLSLVRLDSPSCAEITHCDT